MDNIKLYKSQLNGNVTVCSSKSVAHRAIIAGALSADKLIIKNVDYSKDITATLNGLKALDVDVRYENNTVTINKSKIKRNGIAEFNAIESGSTLRFLIPVFVALNNESTFLGEGRLPLRPLDDYFEIFDKEGVVYQRNKSYLPLKTKGTFNSNVFEVRGDVSSQFITGLMLGAIAGDEEVTIKITTNLESRPYVDITAKVLRDFGHFVSFEDNLIRVKRGKCNISEYTVENDWSQAAFFLAGGAISGNVTLCDMNPDSAQGDKEIVSLLKKMGADLTVGKDYVNVKKSELRGIKIDVSQIPDLVPILSVLGACADGETEIFNAKRLRLKESDRLMSVTEMLNGMGISVEMGEDYLKIKGKGEFKSCTVDSFNDHRIVMSAAIAATKADEIKILNHNAVSKSYPEFFSDYIKIGGKGEYTNE